jgi:LCP family protein required for cell wall assembly
MYDCKISIKPHSPHRGCLRLSIIGFGIFILTLLYLLAPIRTNILILGIDARPEEGNLGRSDTMILTTIIPSRPYVGALSIPRDLWVTVPGYGENRINTAHFYAESEHPGYGPVAAMDTVRVIFGANINYYIRLRFDGIQYLVDAIGGLDIDLTGPISGYTSGKHHFTGQQALAFIRDRTGSDDFFRMEHAQLFIKSLFRQILKPSAWLHIPAILFELPKTVDTDIPIWQWPRLGLAFVRTGPNGIDSRTINRDMVTPFTTTGGAMVLSPNWQKINPLLMDMFGQ